MIEYESFGSYQSPRGMIWFVYSEKLRDRDDTGLVGQTVKIDGVEHLVKGVESFCTIHINKGDKIGILV